MKNSEVTLNLYKMPHLLESLSIVTNDDTSFTLKTGRFYESIVRINLARPIII